MGLSLTLFELYVTVHAERYHVGKSDFEIRALTAATANLLQFPFL